MIASAGLSILLLALFGSEVISLPLLDLRALGIFALALAALRIFKPDPIWVMAGAGVLAASCTRYRESAEHPLQLLVFFVGDECVVLVFSRRTT